MAVLPAIRMHRALINHIRHGILWITRLKPMPTFKAVDLAMGQILRVAETRYRAAFPAMTTARRSLYTHYHITTLRNTGRLQKKTNFCAAAVTAGRLTTLTAVWYRIQIFSTISPDPVPRPHVTRPLWPTRPTGRDPMKTRIQAMIRVTKRSIWTQLIRVACSAIKPKGPEWDRYPKLPAVSRLILPTAMGLRPDVIPAARVFPPLMTCLLPKQLPTVPMLKQI